MKKIISLLPLWITILMFSGCSAGFNSYKKGDYYKASLEAIERLRDNPNSNKAEFVLSKSYPLALKMAQHEIDNANLAGSDDQYDMIVFQYERVNQLANAIYNCPKALEMIPSPKEYVAELSDAKKMAAQSAYNRGVQALNAGGMDEARLAYNYFTKANNYVNGYNDVQQKINESRYFATLRVLVRQPLTNKAYQYTADYFYNNLLLDLGRMTKGRFIRFYSEDEAYRENMRDPHQYIMLNFNNFVISNIRESSNTVELKKDSVLVGTVKIQGKNQNVYGPVKARLISMSREIVADGATNIAEFDAPTGKLIDQRNFFNSYVWRTIWASYKGDDRALTNEQKRLCDVQPQIPPSDQDFFNYYSSPVYTQLLSYLRVFYAKY